MTFSPKQKQQSDFMVKRNNFALSNGNPLTLKKNKQILPPIDTQTKNQKNTDIQSSGNNTPLLIKKVNNLGVGNNRSATLRPSSFIKKVANTNNKVGPVSSISLERPMTH